MGIEELPEAEWVTDMRRHYAEHGFCRQGDLDRLLGKPGQSAAVDENGNVYLRDATNTNSGGGE